MTFKEMYTALLDYADTSSIVHEDQAKKAINDAIRWANRNHMFKLAEGIVNIPYPADALYVQMDAVCDTGLLVPITVQRVTDSTTYEGIPLRIMDYARVQHRRYNLYNKENPQMAEFYNDVDVQEQPYYKENEFIFFLLNSGFGLYPIPTQEIRLLIHFNERLPELTLDADTNFLTEFCPDFILSKALFSKFIMFLPEDRRVLLDKEILLTEWESVKAWDKQIRNSEHTFEQI